MCSKTEELISDRQQSSGSVSAQLLPCPAAPPLHLPREPRVQLNLQSGSFWSDHTPEKSPAPAPLTSQSAQSHRKFQGCSFLTEINLFSQKPDQGLLGGFQQKRFPHCSLKRQNSVLHHCFSYFSLFPSSPSLFMFSEKQLPVLKVLIFFSKKNTSVRT